MNFNLTYKDLRLSKIWQDYLNQDIENDYKGYFSILDCLISCQQAVVDSKMTLPKWQVFIDTFTTKIILHCNTVSKLIIGIDLKSIRLNYDFKIIDLPSIHVLFRAQLECFLMLDFIYCQPKKEEEKEFRYWNWMYHSLLNRIKIPAETGSIRNQQNDDKREILILRDKIKKSPYFNSLTKNQQKRIIDNGDAKLFKTWKNLMELSKLNDNVFRGVYPILSEYAHTGAHSLLNFQTQAIGYHKNHQVGHLILFLSKLILCLFISRFKSIFKSAELTYNSFTNITTEIEYYVQTAKYGFK